VQIIVPRVAAATTEQENLQHTKFSVPATLSLLSPLTFDKQKHALPK
jgi:hypothetical protein